MITLETAIKLKELGFAQDTLLYYEDTDDGWAIILNDLNFPAVGLIAAPSFEEVWEQLPFHKAFVKLNKTMVTLHYDYLSIHEIINDGNVVESLALLWIRDLTVTEYDKHTATK